MDGRPANKATRRPVNRPSRGRRARSGRGGFTLVEVLIASVIATFVLGSVAMTMSQLGRLKETSKLRLDAHLRAEAALNALRRDIASVVRHDDLYWTRLLIREGTMYSPIGDVMRDEILVFNTRLSSIQDLDFSGEGTQYETQYRIEETQHGAMLWQRRDSVPDENPLAGGIATPLVESVIGMKVEAYDGFEWTSQWDSDERGLPLAVRITVAASGSRTAEDLYDGPIVQLRAVVPIDRVLPPADRMRPTEEELEEMLAEAEDVTDEAINSSDAGGRRGGGRPSAGPPGSPGGPGNPGGAPGQPSKPGRGLRGGGSGGRRPTGTSPGTGAAPQ